MVRIFGDYHHAVKARHTQFGGENMLECLLVRLVEMGKEMIGCLFVASL